MPDADSEPEQPSLSEWFRRCDLLLATALWGALAATLVLLARGLPARTFFVGDPGVKLVVARNAIEHPTRPLDITLPRIGEHPVEFLDPFFRLHGGHAHATTSDVFPLVSAPLIVVFGIRGAYVLPALGFLLMLAATGWLGVALDRRRSLTVLVFVTAACTPLLFYALEFWEHALAVGIAALATAQLVRQRRSDGTLLVAGALLGVAVLLRPEAVWYGAALLFATQRLPSRLSVRGLGVVMAGVAIVCLPLMTYSAVHSRQFLGGHVTSNLSGITEHWLPTRLAIARVWLVPTRVLLLVACVLTLIAAIVANAKLAATRVVPVVFASLVAVVSAAAGLGLFARASIWAAAPAALLPLGIPRADERDRWSFLGTIAVVSSLFVALTAPNDGGGQWGPRYLLFAFIPLAILTADALEATVRGSRWGIAATIVILLASLSVQRHAYKELRGAKLTYERIVEFIERQTPRGGYVVTDLWWLDQVAASLYPTRVMLFADSAAAGHRALVLLAEANVSNVSVVISRSESPQNSFVHWNDDTGFAVTQQSEIPERTLTALNLQLRDRR
jgi:hypothetical protein